MLEEYLEKLKCFDDPEFKFDPKYHKYTYHGKKYISVTTLIGKFHKKFDQEYWSKKKADERGIEQEEILKEWQALNDYANDIGTQTHEWIEDYYNQIWKPLPTNPDVINRINKFNTIFASHLFKLKPLVMEKRVFSKKYPIAGTIDSLFLYKDKIIIVDYKTNKKWTDDSNTTWDKLLPPFEDMYDNQHNTYSIQISLYATILREWGFNVAGGYLLYIGPNDEAKLFKCHNLIETIENFLPTYTNW